MRPRSWLVTAAAVLGGTHVLGVLLGRPLYRPAELLAALCLLAYAVLLAGRPVAAATAVLVIEAALTVPPPSDGFTGSQLQILSPEQYSGLMWRSLAESSAPSVAALIFTIVLLVAQRPVSRPARRIVLPAAGAAILVGAYLALRLTEVVVDAGRDPSAGPAEVGRRFGLATALPLLLALAALTFAVLAAARGRWAAALGGLLLAATALPWIDTIIGVLPVPYALFVAGNDTALFSWPGIIPTTALLQLTAYLLIVTDSPRDAERAGRTGIS